MAEKVPPVGGRSVAESKYIKKQAFKAAQKKRAAGDYTPVDQLMEADIKANAIKYIRDLHKSSSTSTK